MTNDGSSEALDILRRLLVAQERQNQLLIKLIQESQKKTQASGNEVWKKDNAGLSRRCSNASSKGNDIFTSMVENMVSDLESMEDDDYNFALFEFVDKYGTRFQQFGSVLNVLSQLGS